MFTPSFATLLSRFLVFSCLIVSFSATAAQTPIVTEFQPFNPPRKLPNAVVTPVKGNKLVLADSVKPDEGEHTVLLHLWAPNCPPCYAEMQTLDASAHALHEKGFRIIALAEDPDGLITVPAFTKRYEIRHLNMLIDTNRAVSMALQPEGLPTTYLLSANGDIIGEHIGPVDWRTFAKSKP